MAKFDPYDMREITLNIQEPVDIDGKPGFLVHDTITGTIQKISWRMRRNGYSDWDGVYYIPAYRFTYLRKGDTVPTVIEDDRRKGAISEAILRHADFIGLDYETRSKIDLKGK